MTRLSATERRKELVDATVRVALRDGLEAATVRRIAEEAQVSLGTVHYCFGSKQALLEAVVATVPEPRIEIDVPHDAPLETIVAAAFESYWQHAGALRERQQLLYEMINYLSRLGGDSQKLAAELMQHNYNVVERLLDEYADRLGPLKERRAILARMIVAVTDGVSVAWIADEDDEAARAVLHSFAVLLGRAPGHEADA